MKVVFNIFLFLVLLTQKQAFGYEVVPSRGTIIIEKNKSHSFFVKGNYITKPIGIEICAKNWSIDKYGNQDYSDEADDLNIFPSSFILVPGKNQKVKVTYKGKKTLDKEKTYRVVVDEVSLDHEIPTDGLNEEQDEKGPNFSIKLSKRYVTSLFVTSKSFKDDIRAFFKVYKSESHQPKLILELKNFGLQSKRVKDYFVKVKSTNKQLQDAIDQLETPTVSLFSKSERLVEFLLPDKLDLKDIDSSDFSLHYREFD